MGSVSPKLTVYMKADGSCRIECGKAYPMRVDPISWSVVDAIERYKDGVWIRWSEFGWSDNFEFTGMLTPSQFAEKFDVDKAFDPTPNPREDARDG